MSDLPAIPGLSQLAKPPKGSKPLKGPYEVDQRDQLLKDARALVNRENHFIAPKNGWPKRIYRLPEGGAPVLANRNPKPPKKGYAHV